VSFNLFGYPSSDMFHFAEIIFIKSCQEFTTASVQNVILWFVTNQKITFWKLFLSSWGIRNFLCRFTYGTGNNYFQNGAVNSIIIIIIYNRTKYCDVAIRTAQINRCWYDSIYFVLLSFLFMVVLTAPFLKYVKTQWEVYSERK
jgi:hypothetical protein